MHHPKHAHRRKLLTAALLAPVVLAGLTAAAGPAPADTEVGPAGGVRLTQVSSDPYTDPEGQHQTEVEPDTYASGDTIVSAFQVGRRTGRGSGSGSSNIGFATSNDGGRSWTHGFLPGTTDKVGGPYVSISDPAVGYDAKHDVWLISTLGLEGPGGISPVLTSRSTDGGRTWGDPVVTVGGSTDKNWIACDNTESSPHYGNCYTQVGDNDTGGQLWMSTSSDGALTWSAPQFTADTAAGSSGQPVVRPDGTVVVPYLNKGDTEMRTFGSTDGGATWGATTLIAPVNHHIVAASLREFALPSAEVDADGTVYVVWADCVFREGCSGNDIVLSKSADGTTWTAPVRLPVDAVTSGADHFVPGIGVDPSSRGDRARLGVTFYSYAESDCTLETCRLSAAFLSSTDGGATWSRPTRLTRPMRLTWLPDTWQGRMFGQYLSTSILPGGNAFPVIPVAREPRGGGFDVAMHVPSRGLRVTGGHAPATGN